VNRQIRTLGIGLMVLFVALFIQLNVVQVVRADRYDADPGNNRTVVRDFTRPRGSTVTADGAVMAESVPTGDRYRYQRRYPTGELFANVSGYFSFTLGMCFQVSDVVISCSRIRREALIHALLSFVYNTVILAFTMNLLFTMLCAVACSVARSVLRQPSSHGWSSAASCRLMRCRPSWHGATGGCGA